MVAVEATGDGGEGHVGVLFGQVRHNLAGVADLALAAFREQDGVLDFVVFAHLVGDEVEVEDLLAHAHRIVDHLACKIQIDLFVAEGILRAHRQHHAVELAYALGDISGHIFYNVVRQWHAVLAGAEAQHLAAQVEVGFLHLHHGALAQTAEQTVLKRYYVGGGTVAAEHHRMVVEVQVVEDVEEGILRLGFSGQLLDVVDNEHVDALVEAEELVDVSARRLGRGVLTLEVAGWDIQHALAGIALGKLQSHALQEVRLAATRRAKYIERVESRLFGPLDDGVDDFAGDLVAVAAQVVVEAEFGVEVGVERLALLGRGAGRIGRSLLRFLRRSRSLGLSRRVYPAQVVERAVDL